MKLRAAIDRIPGRSDLLIFGALFLAALALRVSAIRAAPLSEKEAAEAWGALHLLHGQAAASASALFSSLTAGVLFLAGPSHWGPRLIPALAGSLAVFLPLLLRGERGRLEAFLVGIFLAFSPALWIASTMAGGTASGFLAAGFCILYLRSPKRQPLGSGLALGLALASGPVGWSGLALAAVALLTDWFLRFSKSTDAAAKVPNPLKAPFEEFLRSRTALAGLLVGLVAGSTGLFIFPRGLGALAAGVTNWLTAFFSGWPRAGEMILLFIGYEPLALVFGGIGLYLVWRGILDEEDRFWEFFAAAAAVWVLLRAAAFPDETLWIVLPLLILGARVIRKALESPILEERPAFVAIQACVVAALAVFALFNLAASRQPGSWPHLLLALIGLAAGIVFGVLFTENWRRDWRQSLNGLAVAWGVLFLAGQAGAGWNATHSRRTSANEIWQADTVADDILRLRQTLEQISEWQTGVKDELKVVILVPEESALGWELLTYGAAEYATDVDMLATPAMLIAMYQEWEGAVVAPQLTVVYRGQAFGIYERRAWSGWPPDLIGWLLYREGPVERGKLILWARADVMAPDANTGN
jgi:hypothetical protein